MNCMRCKCLALTLFLIPIGAFAQTPAPSPEIAGKQFDIGRMQRDVQAARETVDAIAQLGRSIQARQATAKQQASGQRADAPPKKFFSDVPRTDHFYADVTTLQEHGIVRGYPREYFSSRRVLTRYEFAVALQRAIAMCAPPEKSRDGEVIAPLRISRTDRHLLINLVEEFRPEIDAMSASMREYIDRLKKQRSE